MTQSARDKIITHITTNLQAIPSLGAAVYRGRQSPQMRADNSIVVVEPARDDYNVTTIPYLSGQLEVHVIVTARGTPADQQADAIITAIHAKMMSDTTLGGLSMDVQPVATTWDLVSADLDAVIATASFLVFYRTSLVDISA